MSETPTPTPSNDPTTAIAITIDTTTTPTAITSTATEAESSSPGAMESATQLSIVAKETDQSTPCGVVQETVVHRDMNGDGRARAEGDSDVTPSGEVVIEVRTLAVAAGAAGSKSMAKSYSTLSMGSRKVCRICWDSAGELVPSGCQCRDSFLHQDCLLKWVEVNRRKEKVVCEICLDKYSVPFDGLLQEKLEVMAKKKLAQLELESQFSARRALTSHPRISIVVLGLSLCLVTFAVALIVAYAVVFTSSSSSSSPDTP